MTSPGGPILSRTDKGGCRGLSILSRFAPPILVIFAKAGIDRILKRPLDGWVPASTAMTFGKRMEIRSFAAIVLSTLLLAVSSATFAADPKQSLKRVEEELKTEKGRQRALDRQADGIRKDIDELRDRLVGLAEKARTQETELDRLESSLGNLEQQEHEQAARLEAERRQIGSLLGALERLGRLPPEAMLARPQGPLDTLHAALLLRETVPPLRIRAEALARDLKALTETRASLDAERTRTLAARVSLENQQREIEQLVQRREDLSRMTSDERDAVVRNMSKLSDQASDLRQLMEKIEQDRRSAAAAAAQREAQRLEAERQETERRRAEQEREAAQRETLKKEAEKRDAAERDKAEKEKKESEKRVAAITVPPPETPSQSAGGLRMPVGGKVQIRFGETDRFGAISRGVTISSRPGAPVLAPYAGSVMFAGPFRGYGLILIVEHSNGYHSLIAGLGRIDTAVGRLVSTGEPIGQMPSPADGTPDLYFELRRRGQPTNPQRGFGASEAKGHG